MVPHALPTVCFMKKSAGGGEELAQASSSWEEWGWGWGAGKRGLIRGRGNGLNGGEGGVHKTVQWLFCAAAAALPHTAAMASTPSFAAARVTSFFTARLTHGDFGARPCAVHPPAHPSWPLPRSRR